MSCCDDDHDIKPLSKQEFLDHYSTFKFLAPTIPPTFEDEEDRLNYLVLSTNHLRKHEAPVLKEKLTAYRKMIQEEYKPLHQKLYTFET